MGYRENLSFSCSAFSTELFQNWGENDEIKYLEEGLFNNVALKGLKFWQLWEDVRARQLWAWEIVAGVHWAGFLETNGCLWWVMFEARIGSWSTFLLIKVHALNGRLFFVDFMFRGISSWGISALTPTRLFMIWSPAICFHVFESVEGS